MSPEQRILSLRNHAASDWMHRGMALAGQATAASLTEAVLCFDEAIALRSTLPVERDPWFRYALSAGWVNRADAFARLGDALGFAEGIASYDAALGLLRALPLAENPLYARRLAIASMHKGALLQSRGTTAFLGEAVECFGQAIHVLKHPSAAKLDDHYALQAGAWANLAAALVLQSHPDFHRVADAVRQALALTLPTEPSDLPAARTGLAARLTLCRLAVLRITAGDPLPDPFATAILDAVDGGLRLARHWAAQADDQARALFSLGCRIYPACRPEGVAAFLLASLDAPRSPGALRMDDELHRAATAAVWRAFHHFQPGFASVPGESRAAALAILRDLRAAQERLSHLFRWRSSLDCYDKPFHATQR